MSRRRGASNRRFSATVGALVALHCVAYEPGIEVQVLVQGAPPTQAFHTAGGERVELDEAVLHVDGIELRPCARAWTGGLGGLGSRARAHGLESGNGPWRLDLASGGTIAELLRPAPGEYCALVLHVDGGLDAAAVRLAGRMSGAPMREVALGAFDLVVPFDAPIELDDPSDQASFALTLDQRKLFDREGRLSARLGEVARLSD